MRSPRQMIKMLQAAINRDYDMRLLYNQQQWYSKDQDRPVTMYIIRRAVWDENKQRYGHEELFTAYAQIHIVFFLRDMLFELRGQEIPEPTPEWAKAKEKYYSKLTGETNYGNKEDSGGEREEDTEDTITIKAIKRQRQRKQKAV